MSIQLLSPQELIEASDQFCLSTASSQPIEAVAKANDKGASLKNESNQIHHYEGLCVVV